MNLRFRPDFYRAVPTSREWLSTVQRKNRVHIQEQVSGAIDCPPRNLLREVNGRLDQLVGAPLDHPAGEAPGDSLFGVDEVRPGQDHLHGTGLADRPANIQGRTSLPNQEWFDPRSEIGGEVEERRLEGGLDALIKEKLGFDTGWSRLGLVDGHKIGDMRSVMLTEGQSKGAAGLPGLYGRDRISRTVTTLK